MEIDLAAKVAAFCRELGDDSEESLRALAGRHDREPAFARAERALKAGLIGAELEAELDSLDEMIRTVDGEGLYLAIRSYLPLPGLGTSSGAQWWTCPLSCCAGRGRVQASQSPPICGATGEPLVPGPLPR
jgi:hypothetical protein